ncbi:MAG: hypothetical protein GF313_05155 [Caldithrix sp.]|nr:hypothetical protein [Caldithrix sp.]
MFRKFGLPIDSIGDAKVIVNIWGETFYQYFDVDRPGVFAPLYGLYMVLVIVYISFLSITSLRAGKRRKALLALLAIFFFVNGLVFDFLFIVDVFLVMPLSGISVIVFIAIISAELLGSILKFFQNRALIKIVGNRKIFYLR